MGTCSLLSRHHREPRMVRRRARRGQAFQSSTRRPPRTADNRRAVSRCVCLFSPRLACRLSPIVSLTTRNSTRPHYGTAVRPSSHAGSGRLRVRRAPRIDPARRQHGGGGHSISPRDNISIRAPLSGRVPARSWTRSPRRDIKRHDSSSKWPSLATRGINNCARRDKRTRRVSHADGTL